MGGGGGGFGGPPVQVIGFPSQAATNAFYAERVRERDAAINKVFEAIDESAVGRQRAIQQNLRGGGTGQRVPELGSKLDVPRVEKNVFTAAQRQKTLNDIAERKRETRKQQRTEKQNLRASPTGGLRNLQAARQKNGEEDLGSKTILGG